MERNRSGEKNDVVSPKRRRATGAAVMQPSITAALTRAFFEEWARTGYAALSMESVAKRAGVGKAALYRRWPAKAAMAVDVLETVGIALAETPDTGSLESDLEALILSIRRGLRHRLARRIVPDVHAEMARAPLLAENLRKHLQFERRAHVHAVLRRAVDRGDLPEGIDAELAADGVGALIYWRIVVTGGRTDRAAVKRMARFIAAGLPETVSGEG